MKKVYVNPTVQTYTVDHFDVLTASGAIDIGNGDLGVRGSLIFRE